MDPILERRLAALEYVAPEDLLSEIGPSVIGILQNRGSVAHLASHKKGALLEKHQAGFLAFMVKHIAGPCAEVTVCFKEFDDFDCVLRALIGRETVYMPVQLKQLPGHEIDLDIELQALVDKLKKQYPVSPDLVVAIWINRNIHLNFAKLSFVGLPIKQLWFFGDSTSAEITLEGGLVSELLGGFYYRGEMKDGRAVVTGRRFKPSGANS